MKKFLTLLFSFVLVLTTALPASAVTPSFTVPKLPDLSGIKFDFKFKIPEDYFEKWFEDHPIRIPDGFEFPEETEPEETEPKETEPEITELETPIILESRFYHASPSRLQVDWNPVDGAKTYEVEITKANGETFTYTTDSAMLYLAGVTCPRVYIEETSTWASASVRVRAVRDDLVGDWSNPEKIGCDALHMI